MKTPRSILVVVTRRLGDVLLTTPLIRTLKRKFSQASVDVLVFEGTAGVLEGNPDIREVLQVPSKLSMAQSLKFLARIWNRYDLAISTMIGDKPTLYAFAAGRHRIGAIPRAGHWKSWLLQVAVPFDNLGTHTVNQNLKLASAAGWAPITEVVPPHCNSFADAFATQAQALGIREPYVVFHPFPKFEYKKWRTDYWIELGKKLHQDGLQAVISGSPDPADKAECDAIGQGIPGSVNLAGRLRLGELAVVLKHARGYVGTDTSVTHLAASTGVPTIALFGPTNPVKWGPWPVGASFGEEPWVRVGTQQRGNVRLVQGLGDCVPCGLEGCDRHVNSKSLCLTDMSVERVYPLLARQLHRG